MAAPQLIPKWQSLTCSWNSEQWQSFQLLKVRSQLTFTNICSKCMVQLQWMWVLFDEGKDRLKKLKQGRNSTSWQTAKWSHLHCSAQGTTVNVDCCIERIRGLNACFCQVHPTSQMSEVFHLHNNARLHTSMCTIEVVTKFWMVSVATSTQQCWPRTISLSPVWSCENQPARTPWHQRQGTAEFRAPVTAGGGEKLLLGGNTCYHAKPEEVCQQRWETALWNMPSEMLQWSAMNFTCPMQTAWHKK